MASAYMIIQGGLVLWCWIRTPAILSVVYPWVWYYVDLGYLRFKIQHDSRSPLGPLVPPLFSGAINQERIQELIIHTQLGETTVSRTPP